MNSLMQHLRGAARSTTMWVNAVFLGVLQNTDQIVSGVHENLPDLAQYLPVNLFKFLGVAVIVFNLYQRTRTKTSLVEKGAP